MKKGISAVLVVVFLAELAGGLLAFPQEAQAALSLTQRGSWGGDGGGGTAWASGNSTSKVSTSFTPTNNSLLVAVYGAWNDCGTSGSMDLAQVTIAGGGLTWTEVDAIQSNAEGNCRSHIKIWTAPVTTGASMAITITHPTDRPSDPLGALLNVFDVTGYDTTDPIGTQISGINVGADNVTLTLPQAPASDSIVLAYAGAIIASFGALVSTPGTGWSEQYDIYYETNDHLQTQTRTGSVSTSVSWDDIGTGPGVDPYGVTSIAGAFEIKAAAPQSTLSKPPNNLGLVGYWPMNEATSTSAGDFSGNGNTASLSLLDHPATANSGWGMGKRGSGIVLNGSDDYAVIAHASPLSLSSFTISMWYKADTFAGIGNFDTLITKDTSNNSNYYIELTNDSPNCGFAVGVGDYHDHLASFDLTAGSWHHVTCVFDAVGDTIQIYVDGVERLNEAETGTPSTHTGELWFGNVPSASQYVDGTMDEVRIYNRALTAAQVAALYAGGTAGAVRGNASSKTLTNGTTLKNGLVGLWTFDGGDMNWTSGTTGVTYDGSGNNNIGTLTNMTRAAATAIGKLGQALNFDGSDDQVVTADINATDSASQLSLAAWVKPDALANNMQIIGKYNGSNWYFGASNVCGGSNDVEFSPEGSLGNGRCSAADILAAGAWTHIVVVYDGTQSTDAQKVVFYANGALVNSATFGSGIPATTGSNAAAVTIGQTPSPDVFWDGSIDEVRVYNRALSAPEAAQLYRLGAVKIVQ